MISYHMNEPTTKTANATPYNDPNNAYFSGQQTDQHMNKSSNHDGLPSFSQFVQSSSTHELHQAQSEILKATNFSTMSRTHHQPQQQQQQMLNHGGGQMAYQMMKPMSDESSSIEITAASFCQSFENELIKTIEDDSVSLFNFDDGALAFVDIDQLENHVADQSNHHHAHLNVNSQHQHSTALSLKTDLSHQQNVLCFIQHSPLAKTNQPPPTTNDPLAKQSGHENAFINPILGTTNETVTDTFKQSPNQPFNKPRTVPDNNKAKVDLTVEGHKIKEPNWWHESVIDTSSITTSSSSSSTTATAATATLVRPLNGGTTSFVASNNNSGTMEDDECDGGLASLVGGLPGFNSSSVELKELLNDSFNFFENFDSTYNLTANESNHMLTLTQSSQSKQSNSVDEQKNDEKSSNSDSLDDSASTSSSTSPPFSDKKMKMKKKETIEKSRKPKAQRKLKINGNKPMLVSIKPSSAEKGQQLARTVASRALNRKERHLMNGGESMTMKSKAANEEKEEKQLNQASRKLSAIKIKPVIVSANAWDQSMK